ncbi:hypothetical protein ACIA58_19620 [Kribbella sp. NPDC051586]|uniref:hypothetical protein n=1 Tax=Kribbella sp. NPDC051586 TaxID=3364118 RepID=UPI00378CC713
MMQIRASMHNSARRPARVVRTGNDAVQAGKVLYVGISDPPAWIVALLPMAESLGFGARATGQLRDNLAATGPWVFGAASV